MMSESKIEKYLNERVQTCGGITRKWTSPGRVGVPDRIVIFPGNRVYFVEVKTETGKLSVRQERERDELRSMGCNAIVVYGTGGVERFLHSVMSGVI